MFSDRQIDALAQGCAKCSKRFQDRDLLHAAYWQKDVRSFETQIELGILGYGVRNLWLHVDCQKPSIGSWNVTPDIHACVRCKRAFLATEVILPLFQIVNPKAVNPNDATDVGIELGDRVYFMHADCSNATLNRASSNIILM